MTRVIAVALVLSGRLALAPGAVAEPPALAQPAFELGALVGTTWVWPSAGVIGSVTVAPRLAVEGVIERMAGGNGRTLTQGQLRIPIGAITGRGRSLMVGLTHLRERPGPEISSLTSGVLAHAGVGFRGPLAKRVDLRLDLQLLLPLGREPGADPRAVMAFVWHGRTRSEAPR